MFSMSCQTFRLQCWEIKTNDQTCEFKTLHMHLNLCRCDVPAVYVLVCFNTAGFDHLHACFTPFFWARPSYCRYLFVAVTFTAYVIDRNINTFITEEIENSLLLKWNKSVCIVCIILRWECVKHSLLKIFFIAKYIIKKIETRSKFLKTFFVKS